jgi:prevent-host-death family protein
MHSGHMEVPAAKFKATCLKLMERVAATGEPIVVTKRGKPVARLVPVNDHRTNPSTGYGSGKGTILYLAPDDELIAPFRVEWNVLG